MYDPVAGWCCLQNERTDNFTPFGRPNIKVCTQPASGRKLVSCAPATALRFEPRIALAASLLCCRDVVCCSRRAAAEPPTE